MLQFSSYKLKDIHENILGINYLHDTITITKN